MRLLIFGFLVFFFFGCSQKIDVEPILSEVKKEFAPDKRVAIFDITPEINGRSVTLNGASNLPKAVHALSERFKQEGLVVKNKVNILPDKELNGDYYGIVTLSACNIRSKGKHSAELATQSTLGSPLTIYKQSGSWYYVQTPDGYLGWLDDGAFQLMNQEEYNKWQSSSKVIYLPDFGFARKNPTADAQIVSDLLSGNMLSKVGNEANVDGWVAVVFADGRKAFIPETEVMDLPKWLNSRSNEADDIIQTAFNYMGRPYLWGGTSGKAMDCSGFTKTVFFDHGMIIPRDASQQVHAGTAVPVDTTLNDLEKGDLLFFGRKRKDGITNRITHVAIYLGNGKIIHATGQVKIQSLIRGDEDFVEDRLKTLLEARRLHVTPGKNSVEMISASKYLD